MARTNAKRGRVSSIDRLPAWADEARLWALAELTEARRDQLDILAEFNERLAAAAAANGVSPAPQISKSAFNRRALRIAAFGRRMEETRAIAAAVGARLESGDPDELTVMVAETIKTLVFELLESRGEGGINPKGTMELARALQAAVSAQSVSAERRRRIEAELKDKAGRAIDQAVERGKLDKEAAQRAREIMGFAA